MRTCRRAVTILTLSLMPLAAWAAVPVVDDNSGYNNSGGSYPSTGYGASGAYAGGGVSAPVSAQGELFNQLQQMQEQIARQQGVIEVLQNDVSRMKQESLERYQELDRRIGAGIAPAATPDNSSAGGATNAAGNTAARAASAARACSILATTSGASRIASVSPAFICWPSFTRNSNIRPGTLLETRYSVTSACPWIISGPLRSMKKPTTATIAITPSRVRNASSILLFCDFVVAI